MSFKKSLRGHWHHLYEKFETPKTSEFTLTCQQVIERLNRGEGRDLSYYTVRLYFHLSLCSACANYRRFSNWLAKVSKEGLLDSETSLDHEQISLINQRLLKKFL